MRYLRSEDMEEVKKLRAEGAMIKDIAKRFNVCDATISNIVNGKSAPRKLKSVGGPVRSPYDPIDFVEEIFIGLPDTVLFQHTRERDFIG